MPFRRSLGPILAALTLAMLFAAGGLGVQWGPFGLLGAALERADRWGYGVLRRAQPPVRASGRVVLVTIDEASEAQYGAWPFPRRLHADLLDRLHAAGAAGVLFDVAFVKPTQASDDAALEEALRRDRPVAIAMSSRVEGGRIVAVPPWDPLMRACAAVAWNDVDPADTRLVRVVAEEEPLASFPSMVAAGLAMLDGADPSALLHVHHGDEAVRVGEFEVPLIGNFSMVDYAIENLPEVSYVDVMAPQARPPKALPALRGGLVVVARTNDPRVLYPVDGSPTNLAAGRILALALDGIVGGTAVRLWSPLTAWVAVLCLDGIGIALFGVLARRSRPLAWGVMLSITAAILAGAWVVFVARHTWVPVLAPLIASKAAWLVLLFTTSAAAQRVLSSMVPDHVAEQAGHGTIETRVAEATVMFQDIQGYTTIAETMDPAHVLDLVNAFFSSQEEIIRRHGGQVIDFQGDAQMVVFGLEGGEGAREAVRAAWEIWRMLSDSPDELRFGIGIATGRVALGFIRGGARKQFSALGNTTNLASRLQAATRTVGATILVDEATWRRVEGEFEGDRLEGLALKGMRDASTAWRITRAREESATPARNEGA